ncbi:MAG: hypothetical protein RLZZ592_231 [Pseudomonadota bacterium]|jgi:type IV pilus assembly protein PilE|nr:type pilus assembly protein PilE [Pseudomonadota bacterium]
MIISGPRLLRRHRRHAARARRGFTLIELMIAVAVIALLAGVALPTYREQVAAARRADAKSALMELAQRLERVYTEQGTYANARLGTAAGSLYPATSAQGHYTLEIVRQDASGFLIRATRSGVQAGDACGNYTYDQTGARGLESSARPLEKCW